MNVKCWSVKYCPGDTSWCIHVYHPEKDISLCYNSTGDVTRRTEAAAALRLEEKFEAKPEVCTCMHQPTMNAEISCTSKQRTFWDQEFLS